MSDTMNTMAEDDAKFCWCPFARTADRYGDAPATVNRDVDGDPVRAAFCLGSGCMMWLWTEEETSTVRFDSGTPEYNERTRAQMRKAGFVETTDLTKVVERLSFEKPNGGRKGRCGLVHEPVLE
jgi:hypothetical protein